MSASLFDIYGEFQDLYAMATSEDEQAEQVFIDTLDSLKGELEAKSSGYVAVMTRLKAEQEKAEEIVKAYQAVVNSRKNALRHMNDALMIVMDGLNLKEMPAGDVTIKIKPNGGIKPLVIDGVVPDNMTKVTIEPDNGKIREYLKDHECNWAHLAERGRHIEIK